MSESPPAAAAAGEPAPVKLVCRHLWKVYGPDPRPYFPARSGAVDDPERLRERLVDSTHIVAACDVSFEVRTGEIFVIMGLSGSGKSTVVRCLSRLVEPTAGEVRLDGRDLLEAGRRELIELRRHKMGMVFQGFGLLPHLTVLDNVAFPLKVQGRARVERERRALEMIALVGLEGRESAFPRELSGGQQQRVGIARSLAANPELWFLDEPFSALDPLIRRQMQDEFLRLQKVLTKTIVFITHDFLEALRVGDRIAIMKDGRIVQAGTPAEVVLEPADDYVAEFTRDVPRVRVVRVGDILEPAPAGEPLEGADPVAADLPLETVLPRFADSVGAVPVADPATGRVIGRLTPEAIVRALAAGEARGDAPGAAAHREEERRRLAGDGPARDAPAAGAPA